MEDWKEIFWELSARKLTTTLHRDVAAMLNREGLSRNTVHYAFEKETNTRLGKIIREHGKRLLTEHQQQRVAVAA